LLIEKPFSVSKIELLNVGLKQGSISDPHNGSLEFEKGLHDIEPIELTEEWLLKTGFEDWGKKQVDTMTTSHEYVLHNILDGTSSFKICLLEGDDYKEWIIKVDYDTYYFHEVKYAHQLQNIFYLLAGFDLNL